VTARPALRRLDIEIALERGALKNCSIVHRAIEAAPIDAVALITQPEQVRRVGPRAAVVVAAGSETSGWLVSSVLRYAWERRASLVVVAGTQPESVAALAERLDITTISTVADPTTIALDLAAEIGAANAAVEAQLVTVLRRVTRERSIEGILGIAGTELQASLEIEFCGAIVASAGTVRGAAKPLGPFIVVDSAGDRVELWAHPHAVAGSDALIESAIPLIMPVLRAAWLELESAGREDALAVAAAAVGTAAPHVMAELGWSPGETRAVVFLHSRLSKPSRVLSDVVRLLWKKATGAGGLAEVESGWIAVVPVSDDDELSDLARSLSLHLAPALSDLGIRVGLSSLAASADRLGDAVAEGRIAARCSWAFGEQSVGVFEDLGLSAVEFLFDPKDASAIARLVAPEFCNAPEVDKLVESVRAFMDEGSVGAAAAALSIHRNTVSAHLDRARDLGLPVGDSRMAVAVASVVRALSAERRNEASRDRTDVARGA
jgi:hypothetical protein